MLRTVFFYLTFIPATLILAVAAVLFPKHGRKIALLWAKCCVVTGNLKLEVDLEALDPATCYVFFVNHQSALDIPVLYHVLQAWDTAFLAKESLFKIPVFGRGMSAVGNIPINRENSRKAMRSIDNAVKQAKKGRNIILFPEGTRAETLDSLQEFKAGGAIIALKTGLPVAPVIITGTGQVLATKSLYLKQAAIKVTALAPVAADKYTLKQRNAFMDDTYAVMDAKYKEQLLCTQRK